MTEADQPDAEHQAKEAAQGARSNMEWSENRSLLILGQARDEREERVMNAKKLSRVSSGSSFAC